MPLTLPSQVLQGLGLMPPPVPPPLPPVDDSLAGVPLAQPDLPPVPAPPAPPMPEPNRGEFVVPSAAFGHPGALGAGEFQPPAPAPAAAPAPARPHQGAPPRAPVPMSPDAQYARAQQKQSQADVDAADAIAAKRDAEVAKSREELAATKAFDAQSEAIEQQRKAFQEESTKVHAQKQAYVDATMRDADGYKVDQNKYMNEMGLGRMAGWGIAMVLSGIGDSLQGKKGENPVLQMLQSRMHASVVEQVDERDRLKARNAGARHELDKYDQFSASRMAQINLMDAQNEKRLANMIRLAGAKAAEPTAQAAALDAAAKLEQSSAEKAQKAAVDAGQYDMQKKQLAVSQGNLGVARANAIETQRHNIATEQLTAQQRDIETARLLKQGRTDEAKLVRERAIGGEVKMVQIDPKEAQPGDKIVTKDGKTFRAEPGLVSMRDGEVFIPKGTEATISKFQENYEYGQKVLAKVDEIRKLGPEWMSNVANSDKAQQLKTEVKALLLDAVKFHGLGVITGHDTEHTLGAYGLGDNSDAIGWKDVMAGLDKARANVVRDINISMQQRGLDKTWEGPPDPLKIQSGSSRIQDLESTARSKTTGNPETEREVAYGRALKESKGNIGSAHVAGEEAFQNAKSGKISIAQKDAIDELTKIAKVGGDEGAAAMASLEAIVAEREKRFEERHKAERPTLATGLREWKAKSVMSDPVWLRAKDALTALRTPPEILTDAGPTYDPNGYDPAALIRRFQQPPPTTPTIDPRTSSASPP